MSLRSLAWPLVLGALVVSGGCGRPAGGIFEPLATPLVWPNPPEQERIRYVGQLVTSADLKPAVPFGQQLAEALFGKGDVQSMLSPYALCTDGGYPGISDPGYRLLRRATQEGLSFDVLPGASAVDVALLLSGLPTSSYTFKGFPPRRPGVLRRFFEEEREAAHTLVIFESPFRVGHTLQAALEVLGDREAAVCVELTKQHERVSRGFLSALAKQFAGKHVKGEVTLVIAGGNPKFARTEEDAAEEAEAETEVIGQ